MESRGQSHTTWGRVERSLVWARLHEKEQAWRHLEHAFERFLPNFPTQAGKSYVVTPR